MKRSEILALLDKEINKRCDYGTVFEDKDIEDILNIIEAAGMQPPATKEPCSSFVLKNGQYIQVEDSFVFTNKWDEE